MENNEPKYIRGKYTAAAKESTKRYQAKAYDDIRLRLKKGEKAIVQEIAAKHNYSMNSFIVEAIFRFAEELEEQAAKAAEQAASDEE